MLLSMLEDSNKLSKEYCQRYIIISLFVNVTHKYKPRLYYSTFGILMLLGIPYFIIFTRTKYCIGVLLWKTASVISLNVNKNLQNSFIIRKEYTYIYIFAVSFVVRDTVTTRLL